MVGHEMAPQTPQRSGGPGKAEAPLDIRGFVAVTRASELAPGAMTWVSVDRERVLLANVEGTIYALHDACGHRQAPLSKGRLRGHVVECPLHYAEFDVRTGKLLSGPTSTDVPTREVVVEADVVYVKRQS
jgi:nitrite reductase/ring-hydroxylating ferredoxin subunit